MWSTSWEWQGRQKYLERNLSKCICSLEILHRLAWDQTWVSTVTGRQLTASAMGEYRDTQWSGMHDNSSKIQKWLIHSTSFCGPNIRPSSYNKFKWHRVRGRQLYILSSVESYYHPMKLCTQFHHSSDIKYRIPLDELCVLKTEHLINPTEIIIPCAHMCAM
jgi:hypothetical protein